MIYQKKSQSRPLMALLAGVIGLSLCSCDMDSSNENKVNNETALPLKQNVKAPEDFTVDPAKRLTLENFIKGGNKLHDYLENAVKKANDADKKFLVKEKQEVEHQLADPQAAYNELFISIEANIKRLEALNVFTPQIVTRMRKNFLETEAGKVIGVLQAEGKKAEGNNNVQGEIEYQLAIIAQRDQVNFKSALRHFEKAVQYTPGNIDYLDALGNIYLVIEDNQSAAKLYQEMLNLLKDKGASADAMQAIKAKIALASQPVKQPQ